jgi:hypothetical protein
MFRKLASFLLLFCSLMVVSPALATDVYVAATAGTCASHTAVAPSGVNWTSGNTYHLCGAFPEPAGSSGTITVQ